VPVPGDMQESGLLGDGRIQRQAVRELQVPVGSLV
jgi:hypothetical protein